MVYNNRLNLKVFTTVVNAKMVPGIMKAEKEQQQQQQ